MGKSKYRTFLAPNWEGDLTVDGVLMGDEIGVMPIPILEPGQSKLVKFDWNVPNPYDFIGINPDPWHYCLLARVDTPNDPMTVVETESIPYNVTNNNNIAWKNTTVIDFIPNVVGAISGVVAVGNMTSQQRTSYLEFVADPNEQGVALYNVAEIRVEMDDVIYDAWIDGGSVKTDFKDSEKNKQKIVVDSIAKLENIIIPANTIGTIKLAFHFLTDEMNNKRHFKFHVIQKDAATNEIIGGETYKINKYPRPTFSADAGGDEEADKNEPVTITAAQINEAATYNWYDPDGNLIHTGTTLTVTDIVTKSYKLEIISDEDGYKDYDEVEVTRTSYYIESLTPNPASNTVTILYDAELATSAYLMVVDISSGTSNNYILDTLETSTSLNVSTWDNGQYSIALVCDGVIEDAKNLIKN